MSGRLQNWCAPEALTDHMMVCFPLVCVQSMPTRQGELGRNCQHYTRPSPSLSPPLCRVAACCFSFDGVFAFTGETSGDLCAWDTRNGSLVARTSADDLGVNCVRAAPSNLQSGGGEAAEGWGSFTCNVSI